MVVAVVMAVVMAGWRFKSSRHIPNAHDELIVSAASQRAIHFAAHIGRDV